MYVVKIVLICLFSLFLLACEQPKTKAYFLTHPEEIRDVYDNCVTLSDKIPEKQTRQCIAVLEAIPVFKARLTELTTNPGLYGLNIMKTEMRLVALQKECLAETDEKTKKKLETEIEAEQFEVAIRFALIRLVSNSAD